MHATPGQPQQPEGPAPVQAESCPLFCTIVFATDVFFCLLRMVLVALGGLSLLRLKPGQPESLLVLMEFVTGVGVLVTAFPANILLLLRHSWGTAVGAVAAVATFASVSVGVWNAAVLSSKFAKTQAELIGFWIGAGITLVLRVGVLLVYCIALVFFWQWVARQGEVKEI